MKMSDIPMQPVNSSSISAAGYERETQTMRIEFTSGARYDYSGVKQDLFEAFMRSESKGTFFAVHIRPCFTFICVKPRKKSQNELLKMVAEEMEERHGQTKEEKDKAKQKAAVKARAERNRSQTRS